MGFARQRLAVVQGAEPHRVDEQVRSASRTPDCRPPLQTGPDGSITLTFASELPDGTTAASWLPTPPGEPFTADLRLYLPTDDVRNGTWAPAPLVTVQ